MAAKKKAQKKPSKKPAKKAVKKPLKKSARKATRKVPPIPKGFHTLSPALCFQDAAFAMEFYKNAFGAKETYRLTDPSNNKVGHAEMKMGDSHFMLSDEYPDMATLSAKTLNGSPVRMVLMVKNADAFTKHAVAAGATVVRPLQDEFYGYRSGVIMDPFGYTWMIMTQIAVISQKAVQKLWDKMLKDHKPEGSGA